MTGNCTLCGDPVVAPDDPTVDAMRLRRSTTLLAMTMIQHLATHHSRDAQTVVNREENFPAGKPNSLVTLIEAASAHATLLTALSYLKSDDAVLADQVIKMRELVEKAIEQKELKPLLVP